MSLFGGGGVSIVSGFYFKSVQQRRGFYAMEGK